MSGPDTARRADEDHARTTARVETLHAMSPWWRVVDAEILFPPVNARSSVEELYQEGAK